LSNTIIGPTRCQLTTAERKERAAIRVVVLSKQMQFQIICLHQCWMMLHKRYSFFNALENVKQCQRNSVVCNKKEESWTTIIRRFSWNVQNDRNQC